MPTGYTASVKNGETTEFADFAMQCARAFGALITMRDDPSDAAVPERFEASDFHEKALAKAKIEIERLQRLTSEEVIAERDIVEAKRIARRTEYADRQTEQRDRYEAMLAKVRKWTPPSTDHVEMKKFMESQLNESIRFDCTPSDYDDEPTPAPPEWHEKALAQAQKDLDYHTKKHAEEIERTDSRNDWLDKLRKSLT